MPAIPDSHPYDTDLIRLTFRAVVQWSVPMACAVNLTHALELYRHGIGWWHWSLLASGNCLPLSMTLGVARLMPNEDLAAVVHRADTALYAGKKAGRNRAMRA